VDEQQYQLLQLLAPAGANICVIGDPNQAIYGFRGADASCFQRFLGDYPNTQVVTLQRNYRSSGTIVTAASQVIARESSSDSGAIDTSLAMTPVVTREMLDRITVHVSTTEQAEAEFVVHSIEQLIGGHSFYSLDSGRATDATPLNLSFSDFAVLYRTEAQSAALSEAMHRSGIPFKKHGHTLLLERPEVHAILEVLRDSTDARSDTLRETLTATVQRVGQQDQVSQLDPISLQTALYQLLAIAESCGNNLDRFFETIATATEADTWDPRADRVSLLTLHASKGLEFPVVFIVGLEDGILPLYWGTEAPDAATVSEERRLLYVGMTRAQDRLILSRAEQRQWRGQLQRLKASPFLDDIEKALIEHKERKAPRAQPKSTQLTLL
jgi:DNA helicase-2/ATP-dependent DNA helicase PcrA